jgi:hypothetical protein
MALIGSLAAGTANTNIGYIPVNRAGDTMDGNLALSTLLLKSAAGFKRIRHYEYSMGALSNGSSVDLFQNTAAYSDIEFILWARGFHASISHVLLSGSFGGYGLHATKVGAQSASQTYTAVDISAGVAKLRFTNASGNAGAGFSFSALIFGDTGVVANNGTIYE